MDSSDGAAVHPTSSTVPTVTRSSKKAAAAAAAAAAATDVFTSAERATLEAATMMIDTRPHKNALIYMTHTQELLNALSMFVPPALFLYYYLHPPVPCFWNQYTIVMVAFTLLHLPFSFFYHLFCYLDVYPDRIDSRGRKLDQTFIHVASCSFSYALSGDGLYCCGTAVAHGWFVSKLWFSGPHDRPFERRMNILVGIAMYVLPMCQRQDYENLIAGLAIFTCCSLLGLFNKQLGGNGHSLSHVLLGGFLHFLMLSAAKVPEFRRLRGQRWVDTGGSGDVCYDEGNHFSQAMRDVFLN